MLYAAIQWYVLLYDAVRCCTLLHVATSSYTALCVALHSNTSENILGVQNRLKLNRGTLLPPLDDCAFSGTGATRGTLPVRDQSAATGSPSPELSTPSSPPQSICGTPMPFPPSQSVSGFPPPHFWNSPVSFPFDIPFLFSLHSLPDAVEYSAQ